MTRVVIPTSSEELAECITDSKKRAEIWNSPDPTVLPEFLTNYVKASNRVGDIDRQVEEQVQATLANFLKEHQAELRRPDMSKASADDLRRARQTGAAYNKNAAGVALDGKFENIVDFLEVIHDRADTRIDDIRDKRTMIRNAMSSTDPATGGFLVPEEQRAELMQFALENAIVRPRATVIPMASLRAAIPFVDATTNSGSVYGGVIAYWTEEGAALVQSQPSFGRIVLEAKKLTAYTEVPNELRQDSQPSVEALLYRMFPQAIAWFEDIAFLSGAGVGEPLGILNAANTATITQTKEAGQAASTILWENIVNMYARMLPAALNRAVWLVSPNTLPQLMTTALTVGTGGAPIGMAMMNGQSAPTLQLLGRPVIVTEKVNALGGAGDINFVDFDSYLIGDRMAMDAQASTEYRFGNDVTAYRFIERVDGRPWVQSAITPKNGGPTLSPFVSLEARA
jgi:HK97 family phage major capsid protein